MSESYLKSLGRTVVKGFALGLGLGVGAYGLLIISYYFGWLEKMVCK